MKRWLQTWLLLASVLFANNIYGEVQEFRHFDNYGGLNTKDSSILVAENESPDCQNVYFTTKGAIVKRQGYTLLNETAIPDTADQVTSLYQYTLDSGTSYLIASAGAYLYKMDSLDGTFDDITDSETVTADKKWKWITAANYVCGTNDTDTPLYWDGAAGGFDQLTVPSGVTTARDFVEYRNYYIYLNVTLDGTKLPSRFYYSDLKDITTFGALSFVDIAPSDGDVIVGALVLGGDMYVFKRFSIYQVRLTGDSVSPFVVRKTNSHVGAESTHAILNINNTIVFASLDGIYAFNGDNSIKISSKIDPSYNALTKSQLSNSVMMQYSEDNQVWFSASTGTTNNIIYVWDYSNQAWTTYDGINAGYLAQYFNSGDEQIYHGDYSGYVYENDEGDSDNGTAIDAYWTSKWFDFGSAGLNKHVQNVIFVSDDPGNDINVGWAYDFAGNNEHSSIVDMASTSTSLWDAAIWDSSTWGGASYLVHRVNLESDQGRFWNIQFGNSTSAEDFTVYGYSLLVRPMGGF